MIKPMMGLDLTLTVGQVAGVIGGSISVLSATFPLLVAICLIWFLSKKRFNAASWSVASRAIQATLLPTIFQSDSVQSKHVAARINVLLWTTTGTVFLFFVAHFLTPLPLISKVLPEEYLTPVGFQYVPDLTFFGGGTSKRPDTRFYRLCGNISIPNCPSPDEILSVLSSGTDGTTVAGPADMQYRNFLYDLGQVSPHMPGTDGWAFGNYRPIQPILFDNVIRLVEGLIVDPLNGGVGLRNHTAPVGLDLGATWKEDILWIQPETVCESTNFTLHFRYASNRNASYLRDDGAFAGRDWSPPSPRWDIYNASSVWNISGPVPDLAQRARLASWWNNYYTARALNISRGSNLETGDIYTGSISTYANFISASSITITNIDGSFLDPAWPANLYLFSRLFVDRLGIPISEMVPGVDESRAFQRSFQAYGRRCAGYDDLDLSNSTKPYIRCGSLYGVPVSSEGGTDDEHFTISSPVSQQVYACAASVKASVKTVEFALNGTASLANITVTSIQDKAYQSKGDLPVWGVERMSGNYSNLTVFDVSPVWGLVKMDYQEKGTASDIATFRRSKELYLPATAHVRTLSLTWDTVASINVFTSVWNSVFEYAAWIAGTSVEGHPSYSGETQHALFQKWRELSRSPGGAARIMNLIWTDLVASAVVGTKTEFETTGGDDVPAETAPRWERDVHRHREVILYTNYLFAIPAFVAAGIWATMFVVVILSFIIRGVTGGMVGHYLNQTSLGRAIIAVKFDDAELATASTKNWVKEAGKTVLTIPGYKRKG